MYTFEVDEINDLYAQLVQEVVINGTRQVQRNHTSEEPLVTLELHPVVIELRNPLRRLVSAPHRPVNVPFALAEVLWILGGRDDVETLQHYNSKISDYSDDGVRFNAAYGHRIRNAFGHDQLIDVVRTLEADPGSRQAVISMWHPQHDRGWDGLVPHVTKDRACNVLSHFMIRDGALDLSQIVRSNDLMWGTPYNLMQWTHIQEYLATMLGVPVGRYVHFADSLHIYNWHWDEAKRVASVPEPFNLYKELYWDHAPLEQIGTDEYALALAVNMERKLREGEPCSVFGHQSERLPLAWRRILQVLQAHARFKQRKDEWALHALTWGDPDLVYMAATLRFWWSVRWHKPGYEEPMGRRVRSLELAPSVTDWIMQAPHSP